MTAETRRLAKLPESWIIRAVHSDLDDENNHYLGFDSLNGKNVRNRYFEIWRYYFVLFDWILVSIPESMRN